MTGATDEDPDELEGDFTGIPDEPPVDPPTARQRMAALIMLCWTGTVTTKSDTARAEADWIAACACEGFLTTRVGVDRYIRQWLPTPIGLEFMDAVLEENVF